LLAYATGGVGVGLIPALSFDSVHGLRDVELEREAKSVARRMSSRTARGGK
jgi:hypothetical protein